MRICLKISIALAATLAASMSLRDVIGASALETLAEVQEIGAIAPDTEVLILWKSGQRTRARWVGRDGGAIVVRIGPIETRIPADQVDRVVPQRSAEERYREMRAVIEDGDIERLVMLADWLRDQGMYEEAGYEIGRVLALEPTHPEAIRLSRLIEQERRLRQAERAAAEGAGAAPTPREAVTPRFRRPAPGEFPLLSPEEVNILKVWELDLNNPPRILIDRATVDAFLDRYGDDPGIPSSQDGRASFHQKPPVEILAEMFRLRARDMYARVQVLGMPDSLDRFRNNINATWLVNHCATTQCHGGLEAQGLFLYNRDPRAEQAALTNYLIIERSTMPDGRPLLDYENPERSPLLQMALPRHIAAFPHPDVRGWRPVFRSPDIRRFRQAIDWLDSMRRPRAEAPIDFVPPEPPGSPDPSTPSEPQAR